MRLHELAKEIGADSKVLLAIAKELHLGVKSHSSNIPKGAEGILRAAWAEEVAERQEQEAAKASASKAKSSGPAVTIQVNVGAPKAPAAAEPEAETPEAGTAADDEAADADAPSTEPVPAGAAAGDGDAPAATAPDAGVEGAEADESDAAAASGEQADHPDADTPTEAHGEDDDGGSHKMVVTIGGEVALPGEQPRAEEEEPGEDAENAEEAPTPGKTAARKRRGAKILGRIDLPAAETPRPRTGPSEYDPLDPTRPMPAKKAVARQKEGGETGRAKGKHGKPSEQDFVFDPEDNATLSAIRIGHFGGRRAPTRRPPPRRRNLPGSRRPKRPVERPTHAITARAPIGVRDLADALGLKAREILMHFPDEFDPRDKNAVLEENHLLELAVKLNREITVVEPQSVEDKILAAEAERDKSRVGKLEPRPPVVAVMGHVDHGKTTLLDALRKSNVAGKEAGGITQRMSAYQVATASGARVTFLDTPGHKAFTEMRARGAQITDVAVLVVAADDGVMAQTQEAIDHANAAEVPIVVAINKIDVRGANPQMARQQLASAGVLVEDYGGEVGVVECSAVRGDGLEALVERLALETEILELRADPDKPARGIVVDASKDRDMGVITTVVVMEGTLRAKDALFAGTSVGRVRYMQDDQGKRVKEAGPSMPVQVFGFEEPPEAGARLYAVEDINQARTVVAERLQQRREQEAGQAPVDAVTLENLFETIEAAKVTELNVVLKVDAQGTLDVLKRTIEELQHPEVRFKVIRAGVGGISEDDVLLASASGAVMIGFAVAPDSKARREVERTGVEVKLYDVIYELTEDLEKALEGELAPETHETVTGHATVRATFKSSKSGTIAGCYVTDGTFNRDSKVRLVRDGRIVYTGHLDSLRRFKDDVREVRENYECGIHLDRFDDVKVEDVIEAYETVEVRRTLDSPTPAKNPAKSPAKG